MEDMKMNKGKWIITIIRQALERAYKLRGTRGK